MSYARARLWLGISCVGTIVVITGLLLAFKIPTTLLATNANASLSDVANLLAIVFVYAFVSAPFDFFGGYILPKEYKKSATSFRFFLGAWFKGAFIHGVMLIAVGLTLINSARVGGFWFAFGAFILLNILLFAAQSLLAKLIGSLKYASLDEETASLTTELFKRNVKVIVAENTNPFFSDKHLHVSLKHLGRKRCCFFIKRSILE